MQHFFPVLETNNNRKSVRWYIQNEEYLSDFTVNDEVDYQMENSRLPSEEKYICVQWSFSVWLSKVVFLQHRKECLY